MCFGTPFRRNVLRNAVPKKNTEGVTNTSEKINNRIVTGNEAQQAEVSSANNLNKESDNINQKNIEFKTSPLFYKVHTVCKLNKNIIAIV